MKLMKEIFKNNTNWTKLITENIIYIKLNFLLN